MTAPLSAFLTSLPLPFADAVAAAARLGFSHVDVVAVAERPAADLEALADAGVMVCCAALGRGLPDGAALDAADVGLRRVALDVVRAQVSDAARLGATAGYLVSPVEAERLVLFAEACALLADEAARRMVRLCVEHAPGRALATAAATLAWLTATYPGLGLLLDVGHCLISGEDVAAVVRSAGGRLGHVHLDDNDGVGDLHWPLLTGRLTAGDLAALAAALDEAGYRGGVALELSPHNAGPVEALAEGRAAWRAACGAGG
jgi:sugar phosphate isomerase/epimerase